MGRQVTASTRWTSRGGAMFVDGHHGPSLRFLFQRDSQPEIKLVRLAARRLSKMLQFRECYLLRDQVQPDLAGFLPKEPAPKSLSPSCVSRRCGGGEAVHRRRGAWVLGALLWGRDALDLVDVGLLRFLGRKLER